jgi:hypothetical protein
MIYCRIWKTKEFTQAREMVELELYFKSSGYKPDPDEKAILSVLLMLQMVMISLNELFAAKLKSPQASHSIILLRMPKKNCH